MHSVTTAAEKKFFYCPSAEIISKRLLIYMYNFRYCNRCIL